jgi:hypothetical protein
MWHNTDCLDLSFTWRKLCLHIWSWNAHQLNTSTLTTSDNWKIMWKDMPVHTKLEKKSTPPKESHLHHWLTFPLLRTSTSFGFLPPEWRTSLYEYVILQGKGSLEIASQFTWSSFRLESRGAIISAVCFLVGWSVGKLVCQVNWG